MEKKLIDFAKQLLSNDCDIVTARVTATSGSSPRHKDAYMIISSSGERAGTVGGGEIEHRTEEICRKTLKTKTPSSIYHFNLNTTGKDALDMACGGEAEMLIEYFEGGHPEKYTAPPARITTVYIFGGGHVAQALEPLLRSADFKTVVIDDREEFASRDLFPAAGELIRVGSYDDAFDGITTDDDSFIVIVTSGHKGDFSVLKEAVTHKNAYIGMIGSHKKNAALFDKMREDGTSEETLSKIYTPIGEPIFAETPAEIAISIAAEMIKVRAGHGTR